MSKYAVIRFYDKQYKVEEGQEILVEKLINSGESEKSKKDANPQVLLVVDGDKVKIGKPLVKEAKVKIKVLQEEEKGKKLHIFKFKAKSRYRRKIGFRPKFTRLLIEKIS